MKRKFKAIMIYFFAIIFISTCFFGLKLYQNNQILKNTKEILHSYFEKNNEHISSKEFSIEKVEIVCRGNNAYIVNFDLVFKNDNTNKLNKLGALVYKENKIWKVKSLTEKISNDELNSYNLRCIIKK